MKILADENIDHAIVDFLRRQLHDVMWMAEYAPGEMDTQVLSLAARENRIVLTFDRDFGELIFHQGYPATGIVFLRLQANDPDGILAQFEQVWPRLLAAAHGHFIVVTTAKIRVRPLPPAR